MRAVSLKRKLDELQTQNNNLVAQLRLSAATTQPTLPLKPATDAARPPPPPPPPPPAPPPPPPAAGAAAVKEERVNRVLAGAAEGLSAARSIANATTTKAAASTAKGNTWTRQQATVVAADDQMSSDPRVEQHKQDSEVAKNRILVAAQTNTDALTKEANIVAMQRDVRQPQYIHKNNMYLSENRAHDTLPMKGSIATAMPKEKRGNTAKNKEAAKYKTGDIIKLREHEGEQFPHPV